MIKGRFFWTDSYEKKSPAHQRVCENGKLEHNAKGQRKPNAKGHDIGNAENGLQGFRWKADSELKNQGETKSQEKDDAYYKQAAGKPNQSPQKFPFIVV